MASAMKEKLSSRKWLLMMFFSIVITVALFMGYLAGNEFMGIAMTLIGSYPIANVLGKKYEQRD